MGMGWGLRTVVAAAGLVDFVSCHVVDQTLGQKWLVQISLMNGNHRVAVP